MKKELAIIFLFLGAIILVCFCFNRIGYLKTPSSEDIMSLWTTDHKTAENNTVVQPRNDITDSDDTALQQVPIKLRGIIEKRIALKRELTE